MAARRGALPASLSASYESGAYQRHNAIAIPIRRSNTSQAAPKSTIESVENIAAARRRRLIEQQFRSKAVEAAVVIVVNILMSTAAFLALARLIPYQSAQRDRLDEITAEASSAEQRVNGLRNRLPQALDSGKSQAANLRQQGWIKRNQMTIKLLDPATATPQKPDQNTLPQTTTARNNVAKPTPAVQD
ncbi:MAG: hypothetical protein WCO45_04155 [Pseudanabaena sp. ELA607]|jgi:hypothetical protein